MGKEESSYRYLLRLIPINRIRDQGGAEEGGFRHVEGWEFVSERVSDDGAEVLVFRRPA